jgi:MFS transporter, DHA2 family, lincomycin resistance protein
MTAETVPDSVPAHDAPPLTLTARSKLVINLLLISTFVVILNETIMGVAIPHLMADLEASATAAQWLTTAFLLTMAVVIPITGFLIQRYNTRPIFVLAMTTFSAGTLLAAVSPGLEILIVARVIQAIGTAIMFPLLMTTVMTLVPPESRGKTMGNISIVISVAPAIGPTISGIILNYLDWRWMFILVLPIALAALALGYKRIENVTEPRIAPLDVVSVLLSVVGFGGLVYGLSRFGETSGEPGPLPIFGPILIGIVGIIVFGLRQLQLQRKDAALLDLRTFLSGNFSIAVAMMAICMMALFGTIILLPIYMQNVLGLEPLQTGLLLLPGGLVMGLMAPYVGRLYDRFGPTRLLVPGTIIVSLVLWALTRVDQNTSVINLLIGHVAISVGLALVFTPLFTASLSSVPMRLYSHGSAILGSIQQVAGATGIALFIALMSIQTAGLVHSGVPQVEALAGGISLAFTCGAIISLFAVVAAFFVRKPPAMEGGMAHGH